MLRCSARCVVIVLLWAIGACNTPTATGPLSREQIATLWQQGQRQLTQVNDGWLAGGEPPIQGDVLSVTHTRFYWVSHRDPIELDGEPVGGYFNPNSRTIHYYEPLMDGSIPHETGHAILYELGDPRWPCVFHSECSWPE